MRVLSVAYPFLPAGPDSAGGAEQILWLLERGLVQAGHDSIVIAASGSQVSGQLLSTATSSDEITDERHSAAHNEHLRCINYALEHHRVDLIHFHGLDFNTYLPAYAVPKLATLHLPPAWYPSSVFEIAGLHLNCVSERQAEVAPSKKKLPVVPNGIDIETYLSTASERSFLLWIGRICPEKAVHIALKVAHQAGLPAIVAGPVHPFQDHQLYFSQCVQPLLDQQRQYIGPVGVARKTELLAHAISLLVPSLVAETSSLVAMEAISSGTPVIAFRSGALPEIVDHGTTGFIVDSPEEMLAAVKHAGDISPLECRAVAQSRFDSARMVRDYINLYESLL